MSRGRGPRARTRRLPLPWVALLAVLTTIAASIGFLAAPAFAATDTWTGATSSAWSVGTNWSGGTPITGDDIVLTSAGSFAPTNNDLSGVTLSSVTISSSQGSSDITGNPIALNAGGTITDNDNTYEHEIDTGVTLSGGATITSSGSSARLIFNTSAITGVGPLALVATGSGQISLVLANSYSGSTTITGTGMVDPEVNGAVPTGSALTVNGTAQFGQSSTVGSLAGSGTVNSPAIDLTVGGDNSSTTFAGVLKNSGADMALTKVGTGTLTLSGTNINTGATTVNAGTLNVTGSLANSAVTVASGATLSGSGTVNSVTLQSGATISGDLTVMNGVTFAAGSTFAATLTNATTYTQLTAGGTTSLAANPTLAVSLTGGFVPAFNTTFTIIPGTVTGTFSGQPDGTVFLVGNVPFKINYHSAVLTALTVTTATTSLAAGTVGTAYSATVTGSGGTGGPYTFAESGALPTGVAFNSTTGTLSGTPSASGSFPITITTTDTASGGVSVAGNLTLTINPSSGGGGGGSASSTTTVASSLNPSVSGQSVSFTATVAGSSPTGVVTFFADGNQLGSATLNGSAQAIFSTSGLGVGSHAVLASYGGDGGNLSSISATLTETVNPVPTTTTTTLPPTTTVPPTASQTTSIARSSATIGTSVTFSDTVTNPATGQPVMGGTVTFAAGATLLCTASVISGTASCSSRALPEAGTLTVTVSYSGTSTIGSSTKTTTIVVARGQVRIKASVDPLSGGRARYLAKITAKTSGFGPPRGTVTFLAAGRAICAHILVGHIAVCDAPTVSGTVLVRYHPGKDYQAPKTDPTAKRT